MCIGKNKNNETSGIYVVTNEEVSIIKAHAHVEIFAFIFHRITFLGSTRKEL